jgi:hypothetical protein
LAPFVGTTLFLQKKKIRQGEYAPYKSESEQHP